MEDSFSIFWVIEVTQTSIFHTHDSFQLKSKQAVKSIIFKKHTRIVLSQINLLELHHKFLTLSEIIVEIFCFFPWDASFMSVTIISWTLFPFSVSMITKIDRIFHYKQYFEFNINNVKLKVWQNDALITINAISFQRFKCKQKFISFKETKEIELEIFLRRWWHPQNIRETV